jgi:hypothetical protein
MTVATAPVNERASLVGAGRSVGVIGAGVMGQTLLKGLFDAGLIAPTQAWAACNTEQVASVSRPTSVSGL